MKSLSLLVLLGSVAALVLGGILAVTPVFANNSTTQPAPEALAAPITGAQELPQAAVLDAPEVSLPAAVEVADEPALVMASTFSISLTKDRAAMEALIAAEASVTEATVRFDDFAASLSNGAAGQVAGIYVDGILASPVVLQPKGNAAYVSANGDDITLFDLASQYGSQAFLAHNYLAGARFSELSVGQIVTLVFGDGSTASFRISEILRFQALSPDSTQSRFVDLETRKELSASSLFHSIYNSNNPVVLQTCIANEGISTWGRLFIVAVPVDDVVAQVNN
ncbi:MAG: hypothetical protein WD751_10480 [Anaerolineales bacterium]